jgi:tetratricopeptide (TPR) repeat protein
MNPRAAILAVALLIPLGCDRSQAPPVTAADAATATATATEDLGEHHRPVTTRSAETQEQFDRGLAYLYGFNHDEAIRAFTRASELDPSSAMAFWGIAYAHGPHINNPVVPEERARAAWEALQQAVAHAADGSPAERAMIAALEKRYAWPAPEDRAPLDAAYADAMREVRRAHPEDADIGALTAEALMDLHPWDLWRADGSPQPWTGEIVALLEATLSTAPRHPLAAHLYIHAVEGSPDPGRADAAADTLRDLVPAVGHLVHMPSHVDVRRGRWRAAVEANSRAMAADHAYQERQPDQRFYRLYMAHNHHMRAFAAMMLGRSELALSSVREMVAEMPPEWIEENAAWVDGWVAMPYEVLMRFGRWEEILAEPEPAEYLPFSRAIRHYARGVAHAARGEVEAARAEQASFEAEQDRLPEEATFGNNSSHALLVVAETVLDGEILVRSGEVEAGLARLREAVALEDALRYDEPPDWIQPVRHALGATLLAAGHAGEAEEVFRVDLEKLPGNGWSLFGMGRALRRQGRDAEAERYEGEFADSWSEADVEIDSPCFCQRGV